MLNCFSYQLGELSSNTKDCEVAGVFSLNSETLEKASDVGVDGPEELHPQDSSSPFKREDAEKQGLVGDFAGGKRLEDRNWQLSAN